MTTDVQSGLRRLLLGLIALGALGTCVDLWLLEHYESPSQWIPFVLAGATLAATVAVALSGSAATLRVFQLVMALCVVAGLAGLVLHYQGNLEFQLDMTPDASRWELFWKVVHAKAPPAMAPAAMSQLGLLGLIFTYRHPALTSKRQFRNT